ncbi:MAG: methylenetetrahydrofolate reductase [Candidatus Limnocylindria bacterium]
MLSSTREALAGALWTPTFELVPLKNAMDQARFLPPGARVAVTASPTKPIESTVTLAERLEAAGFRAVPHLSARMIRDHAHLRELAARLKGAGIDRAFVVGGDPKQHGAFPDGLSLLRALEETAPHIVELGIPCYPQGHPFITDDVLLQSLREKAACASYMTTQLCFEPEAIISWLAARRAEGISVPVHVGIPGAPDPHRLLAIGARIGVADTHRFLTKNLRFVARLVRSGVYYRPDGLLEALAPQLADARAGVVGLHLFTFNAVEATEAWRRRYLARIGIAPPIHEAVVHMRARESPRVPSDVP